MKSLSWTALILLFWVKAYCAQENRHQAEDAGSWHNAQIKDDNAGFEGLGCIDYSNMGGFV